MTLLVLVPFAGYSAVVAYVERSAWSISVFVAVAACLALGVALRYTVDPDSDSDPNPDPPRSTGVDDAFDVSQPVGLPSDRTRRVPSTLSIGRGNASLRDGEIVVQSGLPRRLRVDRSEHSDTVAPTRRSDDGVSPESSSASDDRLGGDDDD